MIEITLKKNKKKPNMLNIGQNSIVLIGKPPFYVNEEYFPLLKDYFQEKNEKEVAVEKKEETTGGQNG